MKRFLILGITTLVFATPFILFAANIVPCGNTGEEMCQTCHVIVLGQNILNFFVTTMAIVIALVFAIGGFKMLMSAGSTEAVSSAKNMMTNSVIGFVIVLTAWIVIDTALKLFIGDDTLGRPWNEVQCVEQPDRTTATTVRPPVGAGPGTGLAPGAERLTDDTARELLRSAGVNVNAEEPRTSLEGINIATIDNAISLKRGCNCEVTVTGGTEDGHSTTGTMNHGNGFKYDVRPNATLDSYIQTNYGPPGVRSDGSPLYKDTQTGVLYAREGDHWDIQVGGT